jgi:hypothetical protein
LKTFKELRQSLEDSLSGNMDYDVSHPYVEVSNLCIDKRVYQDVTNEMIESVMLHFWDWLDSLPDSIPSDLKAKKTPMSRAIVRNYITGYLHDLKEAL